MIRGEPDLAVAPDNQPLWAATVRAGLADVIRGVPPTIVSWQELFPVLERMRMQAAEVVRVDRSDDWSE